MTRETNDMDAWLDLQNRYAAIRVTGSESIDFLHRQLTCDLQDVTADRGCPGAWLTAKGKVVATFAVALDGDDVVLVTSRDLVDPVIHGLSRFVLNADVVLQADDRLVSGMGGRAEESPDPSGHPVRSENGDLFIGWPGQRWLRLSSEPGTADSNALADWDRADIEARVPRIDGESTDQFLPQMLGLDALGAISFRKGCYPGQEIVARTRHLGRVKRRLVRITGQQSVVPSRLVSSEGESAGLVIQWAPEKSSGWSGLAVVGERFLEGGPLVAEGATSMDDGRVDIVD